MIKTDTGLALVWAFMTDFLADYNGMKLGLCYDNCMSESFWHDGYDISVDKVFTDKDIYTINTKEREVNNGRSEF